MNENMKKFAAQLATDPALAEKMGQIQAQYVRSLVALAKEAGYDLSEEDFILKDEQLSDDELEKAAGGSSALQCYELNPRRWVCLQLPYSPFDMDEKDIEYELRFR